MGHATSVLEAATKQFEGVFVGGDGKALPAEWPDKLAAFLSVVPYWAGGGEGRTRYSVDSIKSVRVLEALVAALATEVRGVRLAEREYGVAAERVHLVLEGIDKVLAAKNVYKAAGGVAWAPLVMVVRATARSGATGLLLHAAAVVHGLIERVGFVEANTASKSANQVKREAAAKAAFLAACGADALVEALATCTAGTEPAVADALCRLLLSLLATRQDTTPFDTVALLLTALEPLQGLLWAWSRRVDYPRLAVSAAGLLRALFLESDAAHAAALQAGGVAWGALVWHLRASLAPTSADADFARYSEEEAAALAALAGAVGMDAAAPDAPTLRPAGEFALSPPHARHLIRPAAPLHPLVREASRELVALLTLHNPPALAAVHRALPPELAARFPRAPARPAGGPPTAALPRDTHRAALPMFLSPAARRAPTVDAAATVARDGTIVPPPPLPGSPPPPSQPALDAALAGLWHSDADMPVGLGPHGALWWDPTVACATRNRHQREVQAARVKVAWLGVVPVAAHVFADDDLAQAPPPPPPSADSAPAAIVPAVSGDVHDSSSGVRPPIVAEVADVPAPMNAAPPPPPPSTTAAETAAAASVAAAAAVAAVSAPQVSLQTAEWAWPAVWQLLMGGDTFRVDARWDRACLAELRGALYAVEAGLDAERRAYKRAQLAAAGVLTGGGSSSSSSGSSSGGSGSGSGGNALRRSSSGSIIVGLAPPGSSSGGGSGGGGSSGGAGGGGGSAFGASISGAAAGDATAYEARYAAPGWGAMAASYVWYGRDALEVDDASLYVADTRGLPPDRVRNAACVLTVPTPAVGWDAGAFGVTFRALADCHSTEGLYIAPLIRELSTSTAGERTAAPEVFPAPSRPPPASPTFLALAAASEANPRRRLACLHALRLLASASLPQLDAATADARALSRMFPVPGATKAHLLLTPDAFVSREVVSSLLAVVAGANAGLRDVAVSAPLGGADAAVVAALSADAPFVVEAPAGTRVDGDDSDSAYNFTAGAPGGVGGVTGTRSAQVSWRGRRVRLLGDAPRSVAGEAAHWQYLWRQEALLTLRVLLALPANARTFAALPDAPAALLPLLVVPPGHASEPPERCADEAAAGGGGGDGEGAGGGKPLPAALQAATTGAILAATSSPLLQRPIACHDAGVALQAALQSARNPFSPASASTSTPASPPPATGGNPFCASPATPAGGNPFAAAAAPPVPSNPFAAASPPPAPPAAPPAATGGGGGSGLLMALVGEPLLDPDTALAVPQVRADAPVVARLAAEALAAALAAWPPAAAVFATPDAAQALVLPLLQAPEHPRVVALVLRLLRAVVRGTPGFAPAWEAHGLFPALLLTAQRGSTYTPPAPGARRTVFREVGEGGLCADAVELLAALHLAGHDARVAGWTSFITAPPATAAALLAARPPGESDLVPAGERSRRLVGGVVAAGAEGDADAGSALAPFLPASLIALLRRQGVEAFAATFNADLTTTATVLWSAELVDSLLGELRNQLAAPITWVHGAYPTASHSGRRLSMDPRRAALLARKALASATAASRTLAASGALFPYARSAARAAAAASTSAAPTTAPLAAGAQVTATLACRGGAFLATLPLAAMPVPRRVRYPQLEDEPRVAGVYVRAFVAGASVAMSIADFSRELLAALHMEVAGVAIAHYLLATEYGSAGLESAAAAAAAAAAVAAGSDDAGAGNEDDEWGASGASGGGAAAVGATAAAGGLPGLVRAYRRHHFRTLLLLQAVRRVVFEAPGTRFDSGAYAALGVLLGIAMGIYPSFVSLGASSLHGVLDALASGASEKAVAALLVGSRSPSRTPPATPGGSGGEDSSRVRLTLASSVAVASAGLPPALLLLLPPDASDGDGGGSAAALRQLHSAVHGLALRTAVTGTGTSGIRGAAGGGSGSSSDTGGSGGGAAAGGSGGGGSGSSGGGGGGGGGSSSGSSHGVTGDSHAVASGGAGAGGGSVTRVGSGGGGSGGGGGSSSGGAAVTLPAHLLEAGDTPCSSPGAAATGILVGTNSTSLLAVLLDLLSAVFKPASQPVASRKSVAIAVEAQLVRRLVAFVAWLVPLAGEATTTAAAAATAPESLLAAGLPERGDAACSLLAAPSDPSHLPADARARIFLGAPLLVGILRLLAWVASTDPGTQAFLGTPLLLAPVLRCARAPWWHGDTGVAPTAGSDGTWAPSVAMTCSTLLRAVPPALAVTRLLATVFAMRPLLLKVGAPLICLATAVGGVRATTSATLAAAHDKRLSVGIGIGALSAGFSTAEVTRGGGEAASAADEAALRAEQKSADMEDMGEAGVPGAGQSMLLWPVRLAAEGVLRVLCDRTDSSSSASSGGGDAVADIAAEAAAAMAGDGSGGSGSGRPSMAGSSSRPSGSISAASPSRTVFMDASRAVARSMSMRRPSAAAASFAVAANDVSVRGAAPTSADLAAVTAVEAILTNLLTPGVYRLLVPPTAVLDAARANAQAQELYDALCGGVRSCLPVVRAWTDVGHTAAVWTHAMQGQLLFTLSREVAGLDAGAVPARVSEQLARPRAEPLLATADASPPASPSPSGNPFGAAAMSPSAPRPLPTPTWRYDHLTPAGAYRTLYPLLPSDA